MGSGLDRWWCCGSRCCGSRCCGPRCCGPLSRVWRGSCATCPKRCVLHHSPAPQNRPHGPCAHGEAGLWLTRPLLHRGKTPSALCGSVNQVAAGGSQRSLWPVTLVRLVPQAKRRSAGPSGDLVHHPDKLDGVLPIAFCIFLATDLLHHPHEADGVGFESAVVLWSAMLQNWVSRSSVWQSAMLRTWVHGPSLS